MINLNQFTFNEIIIYLIHHNNYKDNNNKKGQFKTIIEYSLISKSTFNVIKNYLCSYEINKFPFILSLNCLIKRLKHVNSIIDTIGCVNYPNQLIQYKDIEIIRFNRIDDLDYPKKSKELKQLLNETCTNLKHVLVDIGSYNPNIQHDYTHDGFFKLNKLEMEWSGNINDGIKRILTKDEISNGYKQDIYRNMNGYYDIEPSFIGLINYSTINKISINTNSRGRINVDKLNNILKLNGNIKSYIFNYHITPFSFIEMILNQQNPNTESLSIKVDRKLINGKDRYKLESFKDTYGTISHEPCKLITELLISNGIQHNTTLKKLKINDYDNYSNSSTSLISSSDPTELLECLSLNKSLTSLDLGCFQIRDHKLLSPLKTNKKINTLYCDIHSLSSFLSHCIENSNIKVLNYVNNGYTTSDLPLKEFQKFISSSNKTSLQTIKIWDHSLKFKTDLIELFNNFNINKTINLKFTTVNQIC